MPGKKVTDEAIKEYCELMNYKLIEIGNIAFKYERPNGVICASLKASASQFNIELAKKRKPE